MGTHPGTGPDSGSSLGRRKGVKTGFESCLTACLVPHRENASSLPQKMHEPSSSDQPKRPSRSSQAPNGGQSGNNPRVSPPAPLYLPLTNWQPEVVLFSCHYYEFPFIDLRSMNLANALFTAAVGNTFCNSKKIPQIDFFLLELYCCTSIYSVSNIYRAVFLPQTWAPRQVTTIVLLHHKINKRKEKQI